MDTGQRYAQSNQRLFLALWPDDRVRRQLAAHADQWLWPEGCVRYAPEDWHVTLHFMGDVASEKVQAIAAAAALPFQPFDLVFDQPRLWPRGLAVVCASELSAALKSLHEALGQALCALDVALDKRPYVPHVTLARHAEAAVPPAACEPVRWPMRGFALVVSTGLKAPRYRVLRQYL
ncbi:RNA 2',3'-cyclic phosphodiesterase [Rhodoferax sp.]|uniref:RNA 2',3'-cyclic phosphodiesterase n=1 Tax=Rhodoferax sp. TaxID=50421 RepID=UPI002618F12C|nr:RNA 2',3'-cyclic phosphodiesterase [Rhodoferax sp.]MDD2917670.1 RNA 2',3'-cyclic phosphodiesterase [Rhodoferax sp.]